MEWDSACWRSRREVCMICLRVFVGSARNLAHDFRLLLEQARGPGLFRRSPCVTTVSVCWRPSPGPASIPVLSGWCLHSQPLFPNQELQIWSPSFPPAEFISSPSL